MTNAQDSGFLRHKNSTLKKKLDQHRSCSREAAQKARNSKKEISRLRRRIDQLENNMVFEECPHCRTEVGIVWSTQADGFKAFCPYCGCKLMLCSECDRDPCDYNYGTDFCKYNQRKEK